MAKKLSDQAEIRKVETLLRRQRDERLREACAAWKELSSSKQFSVARELVETRSEELCRAYREVRAVTYGYGTKRQRGKTRIVAESCVTFLVSKKDPKRTRSEDGAVPKFLFAYHGTGKKRTLVAVPTDVECATELRIAQQGTSGQILVSPPGHAGTIACVVKLPGATNGPLYALSCRHVFSKRSAGVQLANAGDGAVLARVSDFHGTLVVNGAVSFDAALAEVTRPDPDPQRLLRAAVPKLSSAGFAAGFDEIRGATQPYTIRTPRGPMSAEWTRPWTDGCPIVYDGLGTVRQRVVVIESLLTSGVTHPGDSGSPVVTADGKKLLGMHIGGAGKRAFMLPAFALLSTTHYIGLADGDQLELTLGY